MCLTYIHYTPPQKQETSACTSACVCVYFRCRCRLPTSSITFSHFRVNVVFCYAFNFQTWWREWDSEKIKQVDFDNWSKRSYNIFNSSSCCYTRHRQELTESINIIIFVFLQVLYTNGSSNDIHQSHCEQLAFTTHHHHQHDEVSTIRGKSLSPPNLRPNRRQTINNSTFIYYNRSHQRYLIRPFGTIRRQKLLAKAKQQAAARHSPLTSPLSPTARTTTTMGKTIAKIDLQTASAGDGSIAVLKKQQPTDAATEKSINNEDKGNSSDSEYSSLEDNDDDNNQGKCEMNEDI